MPYLLLQLLFLVIAVSFLGYGIVRGEPALVLKKAVRICLECIGLG
ncbi:MAG: thioredoxin [Treponema sp.]|nr:thioredoxin [Treponema sp.]